MMIKLLLAASLILAVTCKPTVVRSNSDLLKKIFRAHEASRFKRQTLEDDCEGPDEQTQCTNATGYPLSGDPYVKPGDCENFYQCANGYRCVMPCANGTAFNPDIGVCDWPYNVPGCGGTPPVTTPSPGQGYHEDCVDNDGNPISRKPFEKPGDCDHFYQCSNGYRYEMPCAPGTAFNPDIGVCDWPYNVVGCTTGPTPTTTPTTTTPEPVTVPEYDDDCLDADGRPESGNPFPIPGNCSHFYQCSNGYRYEMPCAPGTAFNPDIGVCDWPYNVPGCSDGGGSGEAPTTTPTTTGPTTPAFHPLCLNGTGYPISTGPFEKRGDCDHFYQCSNGYLYTMPCAPGTVFNPALGVCDWPYNVPECGGPDPSSTTPTTTTPPTTTSGFNKLCLNGTGYPISSDPFEKPEDCDHFYQCSNGYLYTMPCAPGTAFNPSIGVCDWPYNVPGCGAPPPPTTTTTTTPPTTTKGFDLLCLNGTGYPISSDPFEKPEDCDHFYQCSNGYLYTMPCAPGTAFNPSIGVCDWPYNVPGCGAPPPPTTTTTTTPPTTTKGFDSLCFNATGYPISTGPFEKSGDCDHFYQCSNGYLYTMPCAPGTAFNPSISVCDWPYNVPGCGAPPPPTTTTTTTPPTTTRPIDSRCVNATGYPISSDPFEKSGDCDHFYQCSNGYLYTMPCAPGTAFNPSIGVCDWPYNVPGCGPAPPTTTPTTTTTTTTGPSFSLDCIDKDGKPISGPPFKNPNDCATFYQCSNGYRYTMPCAKGTLFNPAIGVCDWPYNFTC